MLRDEELDKILAEIRARQDERRRAKLGPVRVVAGEKDTSPEGDVETLLAEVERLKRRAWDRPPPLLPDDCESMQ